MRKIYLIMTLVAAMMMPHVAVAGAKVTKEEKEFLKNLKKDKGYKDADIKEENGKRYIEIEAQRNKYLVADEQGNILFTCPEEVGFRKITYLPAYDRGTRPYHFKKNVGFLGLGTQETNEDAFYTGNPEVFVAETGGKAKNTYFYRADNGQLINKVEGECEMAPNLPVFELNPESEDAKGAVTYEGVVVVEPKYCSIEPEADGVIYFSGYDDGVKYYGAVDVSSAQTDMVPCKFHSVDKKGGAWYVQKHEFYPFEPYSEDYEITYKDSGEKYFAQGKYSLCSDYYTMRDEGSPWANFYLGMCDRYESNDLRAAVDENIKKLGDASPGKGEQYSKALRQQMADYESLLRSATSYLDKYVRDTTDDTFQVTAKEEADRAFEDLSQIESVYDAVAKAQSKYDKKVANKRDSDQKKADKKKRKDQEKKAKKQKEQQAKDAQRKATGSR